MKKKDATKKADTTKKKAKVPIASKKLASKKPTTKRATAMKKCNNQAKTPWNHLETTGKKNNHTTLAKRATECCLCGKEHQFFNGNGNDEKEKEVNGQGSTTDS